MMVDKPFDGNEKPEKRIITLKFLFFTVIIVYAFRLFSMQIIQGESYKTQAQNIARRTTIIPSQRGEIFDRSHSLPMVLNVDSFAVYITPGEIPREYKNTVFTRLADILGIAKDEIDKRIPASYYHLYKPFEIISNINFQTIGVISEHLDELPGVGWQSKPLRNYVETGSLSHIVGYVGDITKDELKLLYNHGYEAGNVIGKTGIEKQYDKILRGKDGVEVKVVDVRGRKIADDQGDYSVAPVPGKNLVLTIDRNYQFLSEKALGDRLGSVVILKPATGEILSMVSYPWYDPNIFNRSSSTDSQTIQDYLSSTDKPFLNRAIQANYPPASTFKIIMSTALLQENTFPQDKTVTCDGEIYYGDRIFRCWIRRPGHGPLDMKGALANSCNIYYMVTGRDYLGIERINAYSKIFGLGAISDIDLPGEISGFIPTPQWKERKFHEKWLHGDTMNTSIGQGFSLVTPIQMANMVAMIVNEGKIYKPHILKDIVDPISGNIVSSIKPQILHQSDIKKEVFKTVKEQMRAVCTDGTARFPLNLSSVKIAAKTGTAEVGLPDRWHSWLVSYGPYDAPPEDQIVVVVMVEASNTWEWWSTYATAIIYQSIYADQSYEDAVETLGLRYISKPQGRRE